MEAIFIILVQSSYKKYDFIGFLSFTALGQSIFFEGYQEDEHEI
ncbi:MAG: hypothetical protein ABW072_00230 [Sedimenticola sp.]